MIKKITPILFGTFILLLSGCNEKQFNPQEILTDKVQFFYAYSHENLRADYDYYNSTKIEDAKYKTRGSTLYFNCLKNENDGAQLILHATDYVSYFDFTIDNDFKDEKGNKIDKSCVSIYGEWYQNVRNSVEEVTIFKRGYYPDALIPLENFKLRLRNYIDKNRNQGIYVNVMVPFDAVSGSYVTTATLKVDNKQYTIPLSLTVHNAVMPVEDHTVESFLIWYDQIPYGEKENSTMELEEAYYDFAISKRLSPDQLPPYYSSTPQLFANSMYEKVANNPKISQYRMPLIHSNFSEKRVYDYLGALVDKNIELRKSGDTTTDLFKKMMFYVDDEPSASSYDRVKQHDKIIYEAKKYYANEKLTDYPDLYASIMSIKNIVTTPFNDVLIATEDEGGVQTWCPQFTHFATQSSRDIYKERQLSTDRSCGENVWWYGCMDPRGNFPSYHLDADTTYARCIPLMQYAYNIEGEIYWSFDYYSKYYSSGQTTARDIWYDPLSWANCAGDGNLYYPGYEYGIKGPIGTLRLENILAGREEYEYLYMLEQYVDEYYEKHNPVIQKDLNTLLSKQYETIFKDAKPIRNSVKLMEFSARLLIALDKFSISLDQGMEYLESLGQ